MSDWKVLFVVLFALVCFGLGLGTLIVPLALGPEDNRWLWFAGFLGASIVMGTLFTLFLRRANRSLKTGR